jgi:hypothetical protein
LGLPSLEALFIEMGHRAKAFAPEDKRSDLFWNIRMHLFP